MRDISVTLYRFDELPTDKAKQKALAWLWEGTARDWDGECTLEDATRVLESVRLNVNNGRSKWICLSNS